MNVYVGDCVPFIVPAAEITEKYEHREKIILSVLVFCYGR